MDYTVIEKLLEKISMEYLLADARDSESISGILPMIIQLDKSARDTPMADTAFTALALAKDLSRTESDAARESREDMFDDLGNLLSEMQTQVIALRRSKKTDDTGEAETSAVDPVPEIPGRGSEKDCSAVVPGVCQELTALEGTLEELARVIGRFCPGEIPDLGTMLNILETLSIESETLTPSTFFDVVQACRHYVETITLEEIYNIKPVEEGYVLLKAVLRHMIKGTEFAFDFSDLLDILSIQSSSPAPKAGETEETEEKQDESQPEEPAEKPEKISVEDIQILMDFVAEADENLDSIEIELIELEQDPSDKTIINNIFRPFHTIKGVSGFLGLKKINTLSHATENLLDSARSGDFLINDTATDAILASVDTMKALLQRVKEGISRGIRQQDSDIDIKELATRLNDLQVALTRGIKEPLGEILVKKGKVNRAELDQALVAQQSHPGKKLGEILVEEKKVAAADVASALLEQKPTSSQLVTQVKVSTEKLDDLVDFTGELVIAQSMIRQRAGDDQSLQQSLNHLGQIVTSIQHIAMSMRMIPIKSTFMKMIRLVRDLSHRSGKNVVLHMSGEDTEIDRNLVDALYEPMVHMIRNSVDHGIESAGDRAANGKSAQGNIFLRAYHKGGNITIEIEDDGKGLDRERIIEKALSTGLITDPGNLTESQIYDLILEPGFSTAKTITDVSGRGVGMDVVKAGIEKFRGNLNISSIPGQGTRFTISLPLTLAIIDGMLVRVGDQRFVIPTTAIQRIFKLEKDDYFTVEGKGEMIRHRKKLLPLINLNAICGISETAGLEPWEKLVVVVESKEEVRGLAVDELLGKDEYVIKTLSSEFGDVTGFSGGAILSDGRVGLILDVFGIFKLALGQQ